MSTRATRGAASTRAIERGATRDGRRLGGIVANGRAGRRRRRRRRGRRERTTRERGIGIGMITTCTR